MVIPRIRATVGWISLLGVLVVSSGCVGGSKELTEKEKEELKRYVLAQPPKDMSRRLNLNYSGKATLIGYDIEPRGIVKPGERVKLTMYWRADKDIEPGWNLFTHVLDGSGERILNIDNVGPLRQWREPRGQVMGPGDWQTGKVYVDEQEFMVPTSVKTSRIQVVTGIWKDQDRMKIASGPHDRVNRGIVASIATGIAAQGERFRSTRTPLLRVDKIDPELKIAVDGKLDEDAWKRASMAGPFIDVATGESSRDFPVQGGVKIVWDDEGMYLGFTIRNPDIIGGFDKKQRDPHLWTKDTVEIMVDPAGDGDNKDYYEIQINPQNLVFDSHFDDYNQPKKEPDGPFGHQEWESKVKSAVEVRGTIDKSDDRDDGFTVEALLPWKSFAKSVKVPPEIGSTWRMNFYAMKNNGGVAWSPILRQGNFHKASRFGRVLWTEKGFLPPEARERMGTLGDRPSLVPPFGRGQFAGRRPPADRPPKQEPK
jgi:hypothetical protein